MLFLETSCLWGGQHRERCHVLLLDDNIVGKMMQYETLYLLGGITDRDIMACSEVTMLWRQILPHTMRCHDSGGEMV